jgi:hypothetical protein
MTNGTRQICSDVATVSFPSDCFRNVDFEYTVTNNCFETGCADAVIINLEVQRDGNSTNLTESIPVPRVVSPGQSLKITEPFVLDFCVARELNVTSSVLANTANMTFCAADNVTSVLIQNALALTSDAHETEAFMVPRSRIYASICLIALLLF